MYSYEKVYDDGKQRVIQSDYVSRKSDFDSSIRTNDLGEPIVYTDGACYNNGRNDAAAGIGNYWSEFNRYNVSRRLEGRPTNNRAEIQAAVVAVQSALEQGFRTLDIHTDSEFMILSITQWMNRWKRNGWKLYDGGPVKNKDDWLALDRGIRRLDHITWTKVKGHSRDYGNQMADQFANRGVNK